MRVTREEVIKMARIAKLSTSEEDIKRYQEKLEDLLEFIDTMRDNSTLGDTIPMKYDAWLEEEMLAEGEESSRIEPLG